LDASIKWTQDRLASGLWRWCLFLVLIFHRPINEFVWKFSWLLIMKLINESIYWHGIGRISNSLNKLLHEVLGCATTVIPLIFFCKMKNLPAVGRVTPKNYSIFYNRRKVCIVNWFERVNVTDMDHWPNGVTCSA